jgi:hypothetical protein
LNWPDQEEFDASPSLLLPGTKPGRKYPGVINNQYIIWPQIFNQVTKTSMFDPACLSVEDKKARPISFEKRNLCNQ